MNIPKEIFRAYDIRGIYPDSLNEHIAEQIGKALGTRLGKLGLKKISIGRDGRLSGPNLLKALTKGLLSTGADVFDVGMAPTPVIYYAGKKLTNGSSIAITGSHNPANYNGLKMTLKHTTLATDSIRSIVSEIEQQQFSVGQGQLVKQGSVVNDYINEISQKITLDQPLRVAVDCGNGVTGPIAVALLKKLGCDVIALFCDIDGCFPNHHADPSKYENLVDLQQAVIKNQADIGIAFDGDGDRIGVIDASGGVIDADRLLMIFAEEVLSKYPNSEILFDVKCSINLPQWIESKGGKATMCRTGHSFIKQAIKESNAKLAGEMSGHIFFNDDWYGFDDALYSMARLLSILSKTAQSSTAFFSRLPNSFNTPEINLPCKEEGENQRIIEQLVASAKFDAAKITTIDGLRVDFSDSWGLIRSSNTTPVLVLRFEASSEEGLANVIQKFKGLLATCYTGELNF